MKLVKFFIVALLQVFIFVGPAMAAEAPVVEGEGTIHAVELESNTLVINGVRYHVAFDALVEIRGSYGAFSMLEQDMKVVFEFRRHSPTNLEIFDLEQLPDNTRMEET